MDLNALKDFMLVAKHGGLGAASRASGKPKATLSRQVSRLEDDLRVRLVERGSNAWRLTEDGHLLATRSADILAELEDLGTAISGGDRLPSGILRVSAPLLFSQLHLGQIGAAFCKRYPDVQLEVHSDNRFVDLIDEGFDVVIRGNPPIEQELVGRRFLTDDLVIVASPDKMTWSQTGEIPAIVLTGFKGNPQWRLARREDARQPPIISVLRLPSYLMIRTAVLAGAGIAALPRSIVEEDLRAGTLTDLGSIEGGHIDFWILHTARRLASAKVTAFSDFVVEWFRART
ncbi:LysR family transcriptional regulator [Rhizobium sp. KAs_5_22]|uniref:LysR family transcriptional regulator n=1 Tax=Ciceribacter selenitireducens TaxID=448181 RepID=UPI00048B0FE3|nr:LysR family transcriptional regulator [Ciceribacter selenitireducens]PPJ49123.1 LysR family transcriptional regulator [Rhizobium sp. KAs_5_22]